MKGEPTTVFCESLRTQTKIWHLSLAPEKLMCRNEDGGLAGKLHFREVTTA